MTTRIRHPRTGRSQQAADVTAIDLGGKFALVDPAPVNPVLFSTLREHLEYDELRFEAGGPLGHQSRPVTRRLFNVDDRGRLVVMAGAVPTIVGVLREHGLQVTIRDHRRWPPRCEQPNAGLLGELTEPERQLLNAITTNHLGQIVVQGQTETVRTIELICRYWRDAIVLMPVATRRRLDDLYDALAGPLRGRLSKARGRNWSSGTNRVVCTYDSLATVRADSVDIVIFSEPSTVLNKKVFEAVAELPAEILRYSIFQSGYSLDPASQLRLESLCGPVIWRTPDPRGEPAGVRVTVCDGPSVPLINSQGPLDRKRRAYWHNGPRNRIVAQIATAFAEADQTALWQHGIGLDEGEELPAGRRARVAVLVESPEHGEAVGQMLPGWSLLTAVPNRQATAAVGVLPDRSIVTLAYANKLKQFDPEVLLVTTAEDWIVQVPGFPPRIRQTPAPEAMVIDMGDDFDKTATRNTRRRLSAYRCRGWRLRAPRRWTTTGEPAGNPADPRSTY